MFPTANPVTEATLMVLVVAVERFASGRLVVVVVWTPVPPAPVSSSPHPEMPVPGLTRMVPPPSIQIVPVAVGHPLILYFPDALIIFPVPWTAASIAVQQAVSSATPFPAHEKLNSG